MSERGSGQRRRSRWRVVCLVVVLILVALAAWLVPKWRQAVRQRDAVAMIRAVGGTVAYEPVPVDGAIWPLDARSEPAPSLCESLLGTDFCRRVMLVQFVALDESERGLVPLEKTHYVTSTEAPQIGELTGLQWLALDAGRLSDEDLQFLSRLSDLRGLWLSGTQTPNGGVVHLRAMPHLRRLFLPHARVDDVGLESLGALRELEYLDLSNTPITDVGVAYLQRLSKLRYLSLAEAGVGDDALDHLWGMPELEFLDLSGTNVSDRGLERLKGMQRLRRLFLAGTGVTDSGTEHLRTLRRLEVLDLSGIALTDKGAEHFRKLTNLKTLLVPYSRLTGRGVSQWAELSRLQKLDLTGASLDDDGAKHLEAFPNLTHLVLAATEITDAGAAHLKKLTKLQSLSLAATDVSDAGLAHLQNVSQLKELRLNESRCTLSGVVHLFTQLQHRRLEEALEAVGRVERDAEGHIVSLDLSGIQVTDDCLDWIVQLSRLKWLRIGGGPVTDAGLAKLAQLKDLTLLDLNGTSISDAGLASLEHLTSLRTLHVAGTQVTEDGAAAFAEAVAGRVRVYRVNFDQQRTALPGGFDTSPHVQVAHARLNQGLIDEAEKHLRKALEHRPDRKEAHLGLARIFNARGDAVHAAAECRAALEIDPGYFDAHMNLALIQRDMGQMEDARRHLAEALRIKPRDPFANYYTGEDLLRQGDFKQAVVYLRRAIQYDENCALALLALAAVHMRADLPDLYDPRQAIQLAERACQATGFADTGALEILANLYAAVGRMEDALGAAGHARSIAMAQGDQEFIRRIDAAIASWKNR